MKLQITDYISILLNTYINLFKIFDDYGFYNMY